MSGNNISVVHNSDNSIGIEDLWGLFIPKWRWFVISLIVCFAIATLYVLRTPPVYTRTASLLIKDESKNDNFNNAISELSNSGMFRAKTNITNEILALKSPTLMSDVVDRLELNKTFTIRKGLKNVVYYKDNPISVLFRKAKDTPVSFNIYIVSKDEVKLTDFKVNGIDIGDSYKVNIGSYVDTPIGEITIERSKYWSDNIVGKSLKYSLQSVETVAKKYSESLVAELGKKDATIIDLTINETSPKKAEDILNSLIEVYNERWIEDKNQIAISTSQFIGDRLTVIENELGNVDKNISNYKSANLLPDVHAASGIYMAQSAENEKELMTLNGRLANAQFIRGELNSRKLNQTLPTNMDLDNGNIEAQIDEYNKMVLDRNRLVANSSEKNPLVKDLTNSLQSLQQNIIQSVDNMIVSLNMQVRNRQKQEASTASHLASNPNQAKYLLSVERQQKVKEELYLFLLTKREENELSQAFTAYNTRIITPPIGSMAPTSPHKRNIFLGAFAIGLILPALIIFAIDNMNTKLRGRKDLEEITAPLAGEIPLYTTRKKRWWEIKRKDEKIHPIVVREGSRNMINEAFRVLRSNINFLTNNDEEQKVFLFTSFNPGSGKSFLILNVAVSFAIKRKRVLLIDGDMRHCSISVYVDSPNIGLSDYLGNRVANWRDMIVKDRRYSNFDIIPVGTIPPNPTELLGELRLQILIDELRKEYDYIFIDCPPIEIVADTHIIEKLADRTFFIIRAGLLERALLADLENIYIEKRFKNFAVILNGTEKANGRYYANRYGYKYGYGYSSYYINNEID